MEGGIGVAVAFSFTVKGVCLGGGRTCWLRCNVWVEGAGGILVWGGGGWSIWQSQNVWVEG